MVWRTEVEAWRFVMCSGLGFNEIFQAATTNAASRPDNPRMLIFERRYFLPAAPVPVGDPTGVVVSVELEALPVEGEVAVDVAAVLV
jgi:hypothetical protein